MSSKRFPLCLLALLLASAPGAASAAFDDLPVSARARAMGEAMTAVADDAWILYHNPAGLALLDRSFVGTSTVRPNDVGFNRLTTLAAASRLPAGRAGGVAIGYRYFGVEYRDVQLTTEQTLSVAHGFRLFGDASSTAAVGWSLNFFNLDFGRTIGADADNPGTVGSLDPGNAWAVGLDVGALVTLHERTRVGFFTRNLNHPTIGVDQEELRQSVSLGLAYEPYDAVTTAFAVRGEPGEEFRFHGGVEMGITEVFDVRLGLETDPNKLSGGFAVHVRGVSVAYGFSTGGGVLDSSHQFGINVRFGAPAEGAPVAPASTEESP